MLLFAVVVVVGAGDVVFAAVVMGAMAVFAAAVVSPGVFVAAVSVDSAGTLVAAVDVKVGVVSCTRIALYFCNVSRAPIRVCLNRESLFCKYIF